jgi:L-ascorbate metabolism protein UlaG (beta-lactamase superfamily)
MLSSCSSFGQRPKTFNRDSIENSTNFDKDQGIFVNRRANVIKEMKKNMSIISFMKEWIKGVEKSRPDIKLPEVKPNMEEFSKYSEVPKVLWFGHSSFLINFKGKMILIDPVFSESAAPVSFMVKRFQRPVLELIDLPKIDFIVISHDHYDHLDMKTVKFFAKSEAEFITPLGVGSHLTSWGVSRDKISELDWWQKTQKGGIDFIATPSQHFSGRTGLHDNETLWASWVIKDDSSNIYFSGDSGYDTHFKEIGDKYGPFDMAFIENGQYNEKWAPVHMMPEQAAQAYFDLRAKRFFPIHWGMFELALHSWFEPIVRIDKLSVERGINLVAPKIGQVISLNEETNQKWWEPLM